MWADNSTTDCRVCRSTQRGVQVGKNEQAWQPVLRFSVQNRRIKIEIARAAVNRPALRRIKRNRGCFAASGTTDGNLDSLPDSRRLGRRDGRQAFVLGLFTVFTAFGRILEIFIAEESLLSGSPDKTFTAVPARYWVIYKLAFSNRLSRCII